MKTCPFCTLHRLRARARRQRKRLTLTLRAGGVACIIHPRNVSPWTARTFPKRFGYQWFPSLPPHCTCKK